MRNKILSPQETRILAACRTGMTGAELSTKAKMPPGSMYHVVSMLSREKLLEKKTHADDARVAVYKVTRKGTTALDRTKKHLRELLKAIG